MRQRGFTLIEMLVGLSIFALLASAGVGLLAASADTQAAVDTSLGEQAQIERIARLLEADLAQVSDRPTKDSGGEERPAFLGTASSMQFVRTGVVSLDDAQRSNLRRIGWGVEDGALVRTTFAEIDGSDARLPDARLVDPVGSVTLAYRAASGDWLEVWPDGSGEPLPRAVRLKVSAERIPPTELIYALPQLSFAVRATP
ncbi:type II secretion system minor pseudopilin GspJ [Sphingomicrobium sp. XHP0235]|uniref:type II secretion system minor pseudopilin GspJ n=1 Tax=Sphingomicrobium aquimarinum TaxID=3133971 RepID=UPI0031FF1C1B